MRKTSQDGGDTTSITSGHENDSRKPGPSKTKIKRNSFKKKVQNFSHESDDAAVEPLLQKDKDKGDTVNRCATFSFSKTKTETSFDKGNDTEKLLCNKPETMTSASNPRTIVDHSTCANGVNQNSSTITAPLPNHMNQNVFQEMDIPNPSTKSTVLIDIDGSKQNQAYNPSPLIFTVAKIQTNNNNKQMEPVQVTPAPISSAMEGGVSVVKGSVDANSTNNEAKLTSLKDKQSTNIANPTSKTSSLNITKKQNSVSNNVFQLNDKSNKLSEDLEAPMVSDNTAGITSAGQPASNTTFADLTKMADLNTIYNVGDIQKSLTLSKDTPTLQSLTAQESINGKTKYEINVSSNAPTVLSVKTVLPTVLPSNATDMNKNFTRMANGDIKLPSSSDLPKSTPLPSEKLSKTSSVSKSLQRQRTTTEDPEQGKLKNGSDKMEKQEITNQSAVPKSVSDKKSSNKALVKSSSKSTESSESSNKKISTTQTTKSNTTVPSTSVKTISKIPSTTSVTSVKSSAKVSTPTEAANKTATKPTATETKPPATSSQTKGSTSKPQTSQTSKASTVSTIISSNIPQATTKSTNVGKKAVTSSVSKTTPTISTDKQSRVSTMKASSTKVSNSSIGSKPVTSKAVSDSTGTSNSTKSKQLSEHKPSQASKDVKYPKT